jgi:hypothetical protein
MPNPNSPDFPPTPDDLEPEDRTTFDLWIEGHPDYQAAVAKVATKKHALDAIPINRDARTFLQMRRAAAQMIDAAEDDLARVKAKLTDEFKDRTGGSYGGNYGATRK